MSETLQEQPELHTKDDFDSIVSSLLASPDELKTVYVANVMPAYDKLPANERMNLLFADKSFVQRNASPLRQTGEVIHGNILLEKDEAGGSPIHSFKFRGAWNALASKSFDELLQYDKVITASAGNHAQGVAFAVARLNELFAKYTALPRNQLSAEIYVPNTVAPSKLEALKCLGGDAVSVRIMGSNYDEAYLAAQQALIADNRALFVHPYNDDAVIEGQGTVAHELLQQLGQANIPTGSVRVFVPIGGGGLASGILDVFSQLEPTERPKVVGVQLQDADSAYMSWLHYKKTGSITALPVSNAVNPLADGLGVQCVGNKTMAKLTGLDDFILVTNAEVGKHYARTIDSLEKLSDMYASRGIDVIDGLTEPASMIGQTGCRLYAQKKSLQGQEPPTGEVWVQLNTGSHVDATKVSKFVDAYTESCLHKAGSIALHKSLPF